jgi:hypothetical protein
MPEMYILAKNILFMLAGEHLGSAQPYRRRRRRLPQRRPLEQAAATARGDTEAEV